MSSHRGHHSSTAGTSTPIPEHEQWRANAACLAVDPELFYPLGKPGSKPYQRAAEPAKAVCAECTVIADCLEDSLVTGDRWGIRGGLDPDEREQQFGRPCVECGKPFRSTNSRRITCGEPCAIARGNRQRKLDNRRKTQERRRKAVVA